MDQGYLQDVLQRFRELKTLGEKAMAQLQPEQMRTVVGEDSNSILVLMKHISGNMKSRWSQFLTSDGEKPDRNRDREFEMDSSDRIEKCKQDWETGWQILFSTISELQPGDLSRIVKIRGEAHTVYQAINRQLTHYGCHVGQIVFLAKLLASGSWKSLSIPRGESQQFNRRMGM